MINYDVNTSAVPPLFLSLSSLSFSRFYAGEMVVLKLLLGGFINLGD